MCGAETNGHLFEAGYSTSSVNFGQKEHFQIQFELFMFRIQRTSLMFLYIKYDMRGVRDLHRDVQKGSKRWMGMRKCKALKPLIFQHPGFCVQVATACYYISDGRCRYDHSDMLTLKSARLARLSNVAEPWEWPGGWVVSWKAFHPKKNRTPVEKRWNSVATMLESCGIIASRSPD